MLALRALGRSLAVPRTLAFTSSGVSVAAVAKRSFGPGIPGMSNEPEKPWEMSKSHHLHNSLGTQTAYVTACGRSFDPTIYQELIQACVDQTWCQSIQRQLREDGEYMQMLRSEGGGAQTIDEMYQRGGFTNDDEFLIKLKEILTVDKKTALSITALQDAYTKIRKKKDLQATEVAANGGSDPYASMKQRTPFASQTQSM